MASLNTMVKKVAGLADTRDVNEASRLQEDALLDTSRAAFELWATGAASFNPGDPLPIEGAMWGDGWLYRDARTHAAYAMWRYLHRAYRRRTVGGASAQVQGDGLNAETFAKLRQYLSDVKSCGTVNERIVAHTALSIIAKQTPSSTDSTRGASNG